MFSRYRGPSPYILILAVTSTICLLVLWTSDTTTDFVFPITLTSQSSEQSPISPTSSLVPPPTQDQSDPTLIELIRTNHLTPPSKDAYNLSTGGNHGNGFSAIIMKYSTETGVFIEAGAYDGEAASNTLPLELLGWKGILVECNPELLPKLRAKHRKAWVADVCLSTSDRSSSVKFFSAPEWPASAQINKPLSLDEMKVHGIDWMKNKTWVEYERPSFPLYSIIAATGEFTEIDFLSLDVQGAEIGVLKNYPFDKIPIKLILTEVFTFTENERADLKSFLASKGYTLVKDFGGVDYLFLLTPPVTSELIQN